MLTVAAQTTQSEVVTVSERPVVINICTFIKEKITRIFRAVLTFLRFIFCCKRFEGTTLEKKTPETQTPADNVNGSLHARATTPEMSEKIKISLKEGKPALCVEKSRHTIESVKLIQRAYRAYKSKIVALDGVRSIDKDDAGVKLHDIKTLDAKNKVAQLMQAVFRSYRCKIDHLKRTKIIETTCKKYQDTFKIARLVEKALQPKFCREQKKNIVGNDPYGFRSLVSFAPEVKSLPDSSDIEGMSRYLKSQDLLRSHECKYSIRGPLPQIAHIIWLGSQVPIHYLNNIVSAHHEFSNLEFILWTDQESVSEEVAKKLKGKVKCINVYKSLPNQFWIEGLKEAFLHETHKIRPCYGAASDILRFLLLYHFGGVYGDTDSCLSYISQSDLDDVKEIPCGLKCFGQNGDRLVVFLDLIIAKPRAELTKIMCREISDNYQKNYCDLMGSDKIELEEVEYNFHETKQRTGCLPAALRKYFDSSIGQELNDVIMKFPGDKYVVSDNSYSEKGVTPVQETLRYKDIYRITASLLWDVKNKPRVLHMRPYERFLTSLNPPGRSPVSDAILSEIIRILMKKETGDLFKRIEWIKTDSSYLHNSLYHLVVKRTWS